MVNNALNIAPIFSIDKTYSCFQASTQSMAKPKRRQDVVFVEKINAHGRAVWRDGDGACAGLAD
jgi:hypothetical protein